MRLLPLLFLFAASVATAQVAPSDFAFGADLTLDGDGPIYRVTVPPAVYRSAVRTDLGDLRVFNASDEPVPHAVERPASSTRSVRTVALPFFVLSDTTRASDPALTVRRDATGTVVELAPRTDRADRPRAAYLLDTRGTDRPIRRLTFSWADDAPSFVTSVQIGASSDLARWTPLVRDAALADLRQGDQRLVRRTVAFDVPTTARFLRVTWPEDETLPPLTRAEAEVVEAERPVERAWLPAPLLDASGSMYTFDLDARPPADGARIALPEVNTLASATLASAETPDGPWRTRASGPIYRLRIDGTELTTPDFSFAPTSARYWRLTVEPEGALGQQPPALEVGYVPETVLFVARGTDPFRLAFGSYAAEPAGLSPSTVLGSVPRVGASALVSPASVGEPFDLAGPAALRPSDEIPTQRLLLWAVLVLGVGFLGWMAWRLSRQIRTEHGA
ncbi:MAG: DUF3999 domain-containing protein [Rhodothermales bacterium]